jgi:uncharacterized protein (TIGR00730 family)
MKRICVYCGSSFGGHPMYVEAAKAMGEAIAKRGDELVYGGGKVGLMGTVADAALAAGGSVIGIMPQFLVDKEIAHQNLTELRVVDTMHNRKEMLLRISDALVTLPGGWGTYDELAEAVTWAQLGLHSKPIGILNVNGFFNPLIAQMDHAIAEGFVRAAHRDLLIIDDDIPNLLARTDAYVPPAGAVKWQSPDESEKVRK